MPKENSKLRLPMALVSIVLASCVGTIGGGDGSSSSETPETRGDSLCEQSPSTKSLPLRRLSRVQYETVLADVMTSWAPSVAEAVVTSDRVVRTLSQLREDNRVTLSSTKHGGFRRIDQGMGQDQVDASIAIASAVAAELTSSSERVAALLGTCASATDLENGTSCVRDFIRRAGHAAHRRALTDEDVEFYGSVYAAQGIDREGLADVITTMLSGPYFVYQVEHGDKAVDERAGRYALSGEELANRLALHFWNSIPDETLLALVDSGRILTNEGFGEALTHVVLNPRVHSEYREFFREYFSAEDLPEIDQFKGAPAFDAFRGTFDPTPDTRENMIEEVTRLATFYASKPDGKFADLFTTRKSFATTADVAAIYGVAPWSGEGEPPEIPDPERVGFITHAALLATGRQTTRPIMKGVFARTTLLCDELAPPPANAMQVAQDSGAMLEPVMSSRKRVEAITSRADCASCHERLINPLGFLTEGFDGLGRVRKTESVFDQEGNLLGQIPVDTTSVPYVTSEDSSTANGPADLARLLVASKRAQMCLAKKYFRYTFARVDDASDACLIQTLGNAFVDGKPIQTVLADIARSTTFRERVFD